MATLRVLVVDDEPLAREKLRTLLEMERDIEVPAECSNGAEAVAAIQEKAPDLVFLDVQMPEMDGFEVISAVPPEQLPVVVFVTAYDQYALRAFEVQALDYLLKPFDRARFREALSRARDLVDRRSSDDFAQELSALLEHFRTRRGNLDRLAVRSSGRVFFIRPEDVDWIEAAGNYARLHVGDESHLLRETMADLEVRLDRHQFLRIHRSTIVNIDRIRELVPLPSGEYRVLLADDTRLTLSRGYREKVSVLLKDSL